MLISAYGLSSPGASFTLIITDVGLRRVVAKDVIETLGYVWNGAD